MRACLAAKVQSDADEQARDVCMCSCFVCCPACELPERQGACTGRYVGYVDMYGRWAEVTPSGLRADKYFLLVGGDSVILDDLPSQPVPSLLPPSRLCPARRPPTSFLPGTRASDDGRAVTSLQAYLGRCLRNSRTAIVETTVNFTSRDTSLTPKL